MKIDPVEANRILREESDASDICFDARFCFAYGPAAGSGRAMTRITPWAEEVSPDHGRGRAKLEIGQRGNFLPAKPNDALAVYTSGIHDGSIIAMLIGRVTYQDRNGAIRETGFGWTWDQRLGQFVNSAQGDEYNYED